MNKKVKEKWIKALRSGKYQQGRNRLRDIGNKFCCLGVLCDLHSKETGNKWEKAHGYYSLYMGCSGFLPEDVINWAELERLELYTGTIRVEEKPNTFTPVNVLNDMLKPVGTGHAYDFNAIADLIEKSL